MTLSSHDPTFLFIHTFTFTCMWELVTSISNYAFLERQPKTARGGLWPKSRKMKKKRSHLGSPGVQTIPF